MDRTKLAVYLVRLFGVATIGQAAGLASMAGFKPQLSVLFGGGLAMSGVAFGLLVRGVMKNPICSNAASWRSGLSLSASLAISPLSHCSSSKW